MKKLTIKEFMQRYPDDNACLDKIFQLRYKNLVCPKCENDKPFTRVKGRRAYQCPCCSFHLYPTQGTIFEKTTTPLTYWFTAIYMQTTTRNGVSAKELERQLDICYKTALRMAHQIKILMSDKEESKLYGIFEIDETYLGPRIGYLKNKKKKEVDAVRFRSGMYGKTTIFGIFQRNGKIITKVIAAPNHEVITKIISDTIEVNSTINTDNSKLYHYLHKDYIHDTVNHNDREWVQGNYHVNNIESFWNQVKRTIKGTHIHVSNKHMQKYLNEVAFRWQHKHQQDEMFEIILSRVV
jgi:transposase-like protein